MLNAGAAQPVTTRRSGVGSGTQRHCGRQRAGFEAHAAGRDQAGRRQARRLSLRRKPATPAAAKPTTTVATAAKPPPPAAASTGFAVQLGAFASATEANKLRDRARAAGLRAFVESVRTDKGMLSRVRVGPVLTRAEADQLKAQVDGQARHRRRDRQTAPVTPSASRAEMQGW